MIRDTCPSSAPHMAPRYPGLDREPTLRPYQYADIETGQPNFTVQRILGMLCRHHTPCTCTLTRRPEGNLKKKRAEKSTIRYRYPTHLHVEEL